MDNIPDEQLLLNIRSGQKTALDELYRRYARKLYVFISRVSDLPDPEDAVQDVFIRIIKKAASFDPSKASFQTWIFRVARNLCIDRHRHKKAVTIFPIEENPPSSDLKSGNDPLSSLAAEGPSQ